MRDSYVLILFIAFIASGTFLAFTGKVEPQLIMTPIVTGFLGLLASTRPSAPGSPPGPMVATQITTGFAQRVREGLSKPPPRDDGQEKDKP